jgi:hypothetical protein
MFLHSYQQQFHVQLNASFGFVRYSKSSKSYQLK